MYAITSSDCQDEGKIRKRRKDKKRDREKIESILWLETKKRKK